MKFVRRTSPYIRKHVSVKRMMLDVIIALMPLVVFAIYQYQVDAFGVLLLSVVTFVFFELLCTMLQKWPKGMKRKELFTKEGFLKVKDLYTINNILTPIISGIIFGLICPAGLNLYIVFIGATVGSVLGKMVYGGLGNNIFNPAGLGRIFIGVCFGASITYLNIDVTLGATPLGVMASDLKNLPQILEHYSLKDLFLGNIPGSMGEVNALLIILGGIYLFVRRSADFRPTVALITTFSLIMAVAAIKLDVNIVEFVLFQLLTGGLLFGAVFMVTDPITSPTTKYGRVLYGSLIALLVALIRLLGAYPEGMVFAIIFFNMLVPAIDSPRISGRKYTIKEISVLLAIIVITMLVIYFAL